MDFFWLTSSVRDLWTQAHCPRNISPSLLGNLSDFIFICSIWPRSRHIPLHLLPTGIQARGLYADIQIIFGTVCKQRPDLDHYKKLDGIHMQIFRLFLGQCVSRALTWTSIKSWMAFICLEGRQRTQQPFVPCTLKKKNIYFIKYSKSCSIRRQKVCLEINNHGKLSFCSTVFLYCTVYSILPHVLYLIVINNIPYQL